MSRYGRGIDPLRGSGVNRTIATPGVTATTVFPDRTAADLLGVVGSGMQAAASTVDFLAGAEQIRIQRERADRIAAERARAEFELANAQTQELQQGLGADAWNTLGPVIRQRAASGQLGVPDFQDLPATQEWAASALDVAAAEAGLETEAARQAFIRAGAPRLIEEVQNQALRTAQADTEETYRAAVSGSLAEGGPGPSLLRTTAEQLGLSERDAYSRLYYPAARIAAAQGSDAYAKFADLFADQKYSAERIELESVARRVDDERFRQLGAAADRLAILDERAQQQAWEGFQDRFSADLANATRLDNTNTLADLRNIEQYLGNAMEKNPGWSSRLLAPLTATRERISNYVDQVQVQEAQQSVMRQQQVYNDEATLAYLSGNGYAVGMNGAEFAASTPDGRVVTAKQSANETRDAAMNGAVATIIGEELSRVAQDPSRSTPEQQQQAYMAALPRLAVQVFAGAPNKYQPIESLLQAGANVDAAAFTEGGGVPTRSLEAVQHYLALERGSPDVAKKYAGDKADFYESIKYLMQQPGIGNDPAKAIQEHLRIRQSNIRVPELPARDLKSSIENGIDDIDGNNYHLVAPSVSKRRDHFIRSGMAPDQALERAIEVEKSRVAVVNGVPIMAGSRILPPGPYNDFKKSAEAAIDYLRQRYPEVRSGTDPVNWDKVFLSMDQTSGKTVLVSELGLPVDLPPGDQINTLDDITTLAIRANRQGIIERANRPREMTKSDGIPWSQVPGKFIFEALPAAGRWWDNMARNTRGQPSNLNMITGKPNPPYDPRWSIPNSASNPPPPLDDNYFDQNVATPPNRGTR